MITSLNAVVTAAAPSQRHILHQTLATHDDRRQTIGQFLLELLEGVAGQVAFIVPSGASASFESLASNNGQRVTLIEQPEPRGYAHAIYQARRFTDDKPFLHLVGDHFYLANEGSARSLVQSLVDVNAQHASSVSAVQPTRESLLPYFGAVAGTPLTTRESAKLYQVETVLEKPTPTQAERDLIVPGLRQGHYLCFFGIHLFTPAMMEVLDEQFQNADANVSLPAALQILANRERYLAAALPGRRFDVGSKYGLLQAQLALGLNGPDREEILTMLLELTAR